MHNRALSFPPPRPAASTVPTHAYLRVGVGDEGALVQRAVVREAVRVREQQAKQLEVGCRVGKPRVVGFWNISNLPTGEERAPLLRSLADQTP